MPAIVYGNEVPSHTCNLEWFKRFKVGQKDHRDEPTSGSPSTAQNPQKVGKVHEVVTTDH
jgi:hypothetical protein